MGVTVVMVVTWVMRVATGVMGPKEIKGGIAGTEKIPSEMEVAPRYNC